MPLYIPPWQDLIEIVFFSIIFYYVSIWLNTDRTKNLVGYFYLYCALTGISYAAGLGTMTQFLYFFAPAIAMLFMLSHQRILQRNFVKNENKTNRFIASDHWPEDLIAAALKARARNKSMHILIECGDDLFNLIKSHKVIEAAINAALFDCIVSCELWRDSHMIVIDQSGSLRAINAQWQSPAADDQINSDDLMHDAYEYSRHLNFIYINANPQSPQLKTIVHGQAFQLDAEQLIRLIRSLIKNCPVSSLKGALHEVKSHKNRPREFTS